MRTNSIRTRLIALLLVATIIPVVLSMGITYTYTKESLKNRTIRENANLLFQGRTNIINYMNTLNQSTFLVYNTHQLPSENISKSLLNMMQTGADDYQSRSEIYTTLQNILHVGKEVFQVRLYVNASKQTTLIIHDSAKRSMQETNEVTFPEGVDAYVESSHPSSYYGMQQQFPYYPPETVISMHRQIYDVPSKKVLGSISIDLELNVIRSICEQLGTPGKEQLYLLDEQGNTIMSVAPEEPDAALKSGLMAQLNARKESQGSFDWQHATHIYDRIDTPYLHWTLVKRVPDSFLYAGARELNLIQMAVAVVSLIIIVAATLLISWRITSPIKRLIGYITRIQTGQLEVRIDVESNDEIGVLAKRFQAMMETINNLILREYKLELANKTNELKALQAQINPHFLNNALQSIGTLALQHEVPQIYSLISSLARMMRYSMTTTETIVPLSKELEHVKAYLTLQKQRFDEQVQIQYELDERTYGCAVPKMILQPIAENYFKHGFEPNREQNCLMLRAALADGRLAVTMENNGRDIPADTLQLLRTELWRDSESYEEEGIGLRNVLQRLRLYYQERAELRIDNREDGGVRVTLIVPLEPYTEVKLP